ncbi:MAG: hypothetical protein RJP96_02560 [Algiphilus sp.]
MKQALERGAVFALAGLYCVGELLDDDDAAISGQCGELAPLRVDGYVAPVLA